MSALSENKVPRARPWEEWSTNLDLDLLPSFLDTIIPLIDWGFGEREVQQVFDMAKAMFVDEEKSLKFPIIAGGKNSELVIRVFMDDISEPDIYLTTDASLCA